MHLPEFQASGWTLFDNGLVTGSSGNLSIRLGDDLFITAHGSILSSLSSVDILKTPLRCEDCPGASWELPVHRAIYTQVPVFAIAHAHPPCAVALSMQKRGKHSQGNTVILDAGEGIVPGAIAEDIARELIKHPLVMVRGHGTFAAAKTLDEACRITAEYESKCSRACREKQIAPAVASE